MTRRSRLVGEDDERERLALVDVVVFLARFSWPFLIGYMLGMLFWRW